MEETMGKCTLCGKEFNRAGITRHLNNCIKNKLANAAGHYRYYHLRIQGAYEPRYWLNILISKKSKLFDLDSFLREIWLECCGHLSAFQIYEEQYVAYPDKEYGDKSMGIQSGSVMESGLHINYVYDFGSTTELQIKVIDELLLDDLKETIILLARNNPPEIKCDKCGKKATQVCCQCIEDDEGWLCDDCAKDHECGEEMMLPVVNSPRVGVCAYSGGLY